MGNRGLCFAWTTCLLVLAPVATSTGSNEQAVNAADLTGVAITRREALAEQASSSPPTLEIPRSDRALQTAVYRAMPPPPSTVTASFVGLGSGVEDCVIPEGYQQISFSIDANFTVDGVNPIQVSDVVTYDLSRKVGTVRFWGTAVDSFFGNISTLSFDKTRTLDLQVTEGTLQVSTATCSNTYIGFPLPITGSRPESIYIQYDDVLDIVRDTVNMPYPWNAGVTCLGNNYDVSATLITPAIDCGPTIESIDPTFSFSGLLIGSIDYDLLASPGLRPATSLAADGVTPLLLRWEVPSAGSVTFNIADSTGGTYRVGSLSSVENPCVPPAFDPGAGCGLTSTTQLTVNTRPVSSGRHVGFAILTAPSDFARNSGDFSEDDRAVVVTGDFVSSTGGAPLSDSLDLSVVRPPVLLLHGLWSGPSTWNWPLRSDGRFLVNRGRYRNDWNFFRNVPSIRREVQATLARIRVERSAAVTQADVIGHSMGGLLSRLYASDTVAGQPYTRPENYQAGDINKLITLDTPHLGSELADLLFQNNRMTALGTAVNSTGRCVNCGAIADLRTDSIIISQLPPATLPVHAIVGKGGDDMVDLVATTLNALSVSPTDKLIAALIGGLDDLIFGFGSQHDLIVAQTSQEGQLSAAAIKGFDPVGLFDRATHISVTAEDRIGNHVVDLLNADHDSSVFDSGFPVARASTAVELKKPWPTTRPALGTGGIEIISPLPGVTVAPGGSLNVIVSGTGGFVPARVVVSSMDIVAISDVSPFTFVVDVPLESIGTLDFVAIGVDAGGAIAVSDPVAVTAVPSASVVDIAVLPEMVYLFDYAAGYRMTVIGTFDDGVERDISGDALGTTYLSANPGVATVTADGLVIGVSEGQTTVTVANTAATAMFAVNVMEAITDTDADAFPDSADNCMLIHNPLQIDTNDDGFGNRCDPDFNGDLIVNFADLVIMADAFFSQPGMAEWDMDVDLNADGFINFGDLSIFSMFFLMEPGP